MPEPLIPATLSFTEDGTPYSAAYDDVYHSAEGGPAQALHVFLGGNGLPARWQNRGRFTVLETGFGFGLNFLATWAAWKGDPQRPAKLHYVSIEKHPFAVADLERLHAKLSGFEPIARELRKEWPMLVPGMHRMEFEGGRVVLTIYFADIALALPQLRLAADAIYLDGFSPAKNPQMWEARVLKKLAGLGAEDATFATYTVASTVRDALTNAGFAVGKRAGFAKKRDMLCGSFVSSKAPSNPRSSLTDRRALVIGAGLAGSAVCERLASRGWDVTVLERHSGPAMEASGNHAGVFHPLVTRDDSVIAQLSRAAFLYGLRHWKGLADLKWDQCGALQMPRDDDEDSAQRAALALLGYPREYAAHLDAAVAGSKAGAALTCGGVWFEAAGWLQPASLVRALLARAGARVLYNAEVAALVRTDTGWAAQDDRGETLAEAPVVVLANAGDATRLAPVPDVALRSVRGQVTYLPASRLPQIHTVLLRGGLVVPPVDGVAMTGASYDIDDTDPAPRPDSHAGNLERLARILPGAEARFDPGSLEGRVGFRSVAPDRLPLVGPLPGAEGLHGAFAYGSRGILWCSLMAELIASRLEGEPLPIAVRLADAVDPGRFTLRAARRSSRSPRDAR